MVKTTQTRIKNSDIPKIKTIRDDLSNTWGRKVSLADTLHFIIKSYQSNLGTRVPNKIDYEHK